MGMTKRRKQPSGIKIRNKKYWIKRAFDLTKWLQKGFEDLCSGHQCINLACPPKFLLRKNLGE